MLSHTNLLGVSKVINAHILFIYFLRVDSCIARLIIDNEVKDNKWVGISIDPKYPSLDSSGNRS